MEFVEDVLRERGDELVHLLEGDVGLTPVEARHFLQLAGPALVESWRWWTVSQGQMRRGARPGVRELLALIPGNSLAHAAGLEPATAWQGLRSMVPAVVELGSPRKHHLKRRTAGLP